MFSGPVMLAIDEFVRSPAGVFVELSADWSVMLAIDEVVESPADGSAVLAVDGLVVLVVDGSELLTDGSVMLGIDRSDGFEAPEEVAAVSAEGELWTTVEGDPEMAVPCPPSCGERATWTATANVEGRRERRARTAAAFFILEDSKCRNNSI